MSWSSIAVSMSSTAEDSWPADAADRLTSGDKCRNYFLRSGNNERNSAGSGTDKHSAAFLRTGSEAPSCLDSWYCGRLAGRDQRENDPEFSRINKLFFR